MSVVFPGGLPESAWRFVSRRFLLFVGLSVALPAAVVVPVFLLAPRQWALLIGLTWCGVVSAGFVVFVEATSAGRRFREHNPYRLAVALGEPLSGLFLANLIAAPLVAILVPFWLNRSITPAAYPSKWSFVLFLNACAMCFYYLGRGLSISEPGPVNPSVQEGTPIVPRDRADRTHSLPGLLEVAVDNDKRVGQLIREGHVSRWLRRNAPWSQASEHLDRLVAEGSADDQLLLRTLLAEFKQIIACPKCGRRGEVLLRCGRDESWNGGSCWFRARPLCVVCYERIGAAAGCPSCQWPMEPLTPVPTAELGSWASIPERFTLSPGKSVWRKGELSRELRHNQQEAIRHVREGRLQTWIRYLGDSELAGRIDRAVAQAENDDQLLWAVLSVLPEFECGRCHRDLFRPSLDRDIVIAESQVPRIGLLCRDSFCGELVCLGCYGLPRLISEGVRCRHCGSQAMPIGSFTLSLRDESGGLRIVTL